MDPAALLQSTPAQLAQMPAGRPPPGVVPNFINPASDGYKFHIVGTIFLVIMLMFAALRFYVKVFVARRITLDDYTLAFGVFATVSYYIISCYLVIVDGVGRHSWDLSLETVLSDSLLISIILLSVMSYVAWALIKVSFLILYLQIFSPFIWLRYSIYTAIGVLCSFYLSIFIASLCPSVPHGDQILQEAYLSRRYDTILDMAIPITAGGLILDVIILVLPMLGTAKLQLSFSRKLGVMCIFLTGLFACICSSISLYYRYLLGLPAELNDSSNLTIPLLIMGLLEMCIGTSAACMSVIPQFKSKISLRWSKLDSHSLVLSMKSLFRSKSKKSTHSSNSSEHIVPDQGPLAYGKVDTEITVERSAIQAKNDRYEIWQAQGV